MSWHAAQKIAKAEADYDKAMKAAAAEQYDITLYGVTAGAAGGCTGPGEPGTKVALCALLGGFIGYIIGGDVTENAEHGAAAVRDYKRNKAKREFDACMKVCNDQYDQQAGK